MIIMEAKELRVRMLRVSLSLSNRREDHQFTWKDDNDRHQVRASLLGGGVLPYCRIGTND